MVVKYVLIIAEIQLTLRYFRGTTKAVAVAETRFRFFIVFYNENMKIFFYISSALL